MLSYALPYITIPCLCVSATLEEPEIAARWSAEKLLHRRDGFGAASQALHVHFNPRREKKKVEAKEEKPLCSH